MLDSSYMYFDISVNGFRSISFLHIDLHDDGK